jgi:hypothetical protein
MTTKAPKWRHMDVGDAWHPYEIDRARLNGWCLDIAPYGTGKVSWYFTAHHKDDRVQNSLWMGGKYASLDEAKTAAIAYAEANP